MLNVRGSLIQSLEPLKDLNTLRKLCVTENDIADIVEVEKLPSSICDLYLSPNPLVELPYYRQQVLRRMPDIRLLDTDVLVSEMEKVKANVLYDDYVAQEEKLFEKFLPAEQFVDRRLITQEAVEQMELEMFGQTGSVRPKNEE